MQAEMLATLAPCTVWAEAAPVRVDQATDAAKPVAPSTDVASADAASADAATRAAGAAPETAWQRLFHDVSAGADLLRTVPNVAVFDGSWSIGLQIGTLLANRTWRAPYPR